MYVGMYPCSLCACSFFFLYPWKYCHTYSERNIKQWRWARLLSEGGAWLKRLFVCFFVFRLFLCTSGSCREGEDRHSGAYRGGSRWAVMLILISWVYFSSSECRRGSHRMTRERLSVCVCPTCSHFQHLLTRKNAVYIVFINYFPNVKYIIVFAGRLYNTRRWLKQKKWLLKRSSPKKSRYANVANLFKETISA